MDASTWALCSRLKEASNAFMATAVIQRVECIDQVMAVAVTAKSAHIVRLLAYSSASFAELSTSVMNFSILGMSSRAVS